MVVDILQVPGILMRRLGWLIACAGVCVLLALIYLLLQTPTYRATAELLVDPQGLQIVGKDIVATDGSGALERSNVDSQIYVILSNSVLDNVVKKLDLENDPDLAAQGSRTRLGGRDSADLTAQERRAAAIAALRQRLQVLRVGQSFVFNIVASHPDRDRAANIANATAEAYLEEQRATRADAAMRTSLALQLQAEDLKNRLEQAEAAVESFKASRGLISTGARGSVTDQQLQDYNTQLVTAQVELERARTRYDQIRALTASDIESGALPESLLSSTIGSLRAQYARIAEQRAQAATIYGANHPQMRELDAQVANASRLIEQELQRIRRSIQSEFERASANVAAIESQADQLKRVSVDQGKAQIELRRLESEASALRAVYDSFLVRAKELAEQQDIDTSNSRVISAAVPPSSPVGPSKIMVLGAAALFGVTLASVAAVGVELLGGRIVNPRELVDRTGVPMIAAVPRPDRRRSGASSRLRRLVPGAVGGEVDAASNRQLAVMRIAYVLRHAFAEERSANVLILSPGRLDGMSDLTRAVAASLEDMGESVLYATAMARPPLAAATGRRQRLSMQRRVQSSSEPRSLSQVLTVEGPTSAGAFVEGTQGDEFLIIDGGSALENPVLPVLLRYCDAILLVSETGGSRRADIEATLTLLQPWQDRMLGHVVFDA